MTQALQLNQRFFDFLELFYCLATTHFHRKLIIGQIRLIWVFQL